MAKVQMNEEAKKALESFFNGKINVYQSGSEQEEAGLETRPFLKAMPKGRAVFLQNVKSAKKALSVSLDKPIKGEVMDTEASQFFQKMEERFRNVQPDMTLFVIDPDLIYSRFAMDKSPDRSLEKSTMQYIVEKKKKLGTLKNFPVSGDDAEEILQAAFDEDNAFSASEPAKVTENNLQGEYTVSLIVGQNPDKMQDEWLAGVPGLPQRAKLEGITYDDARRFTIYHEFGHALHPENARAGIAQDLIQYNPQEMLSRHQTECFADAHAVLQLARDRGNVKMGKLIGDVRTNEAYKVFMLKSKAAVEKMKSPIEKRLEDMQERQTMPVSAEGLKRIDEQKAKEEFDSLVKIGRSVSYYTAPVVDAAVKFAEKALADGSLQKMTDKQVLDTVGKLVKDNALTMEQCVALQKAMYESDMNSPELAGLVKRTAEGDARMPVSQKKIDAMRQKLFTKVAEKREAEIRQTIGLPAKEVGAKEGMDALDLMEKKSPEKMMAIDEWGEQLVDKIIAAGSNEKAILEVVKKEKDEIRKSAGFKPDMEGEAKLLILNETLLSAPEVYKAKAIARKTVRETVENSRAIPVEPEITEKSALKFLDYRESALEHIETSAQNAEKLDFASMNPADYVKALNNDVVNYNKVMVLEKSAQNLAFAIRKNPEVYGKITKKSPEVAMLIESAAMRKHPSVLEDYHLAFGSKDKIQMMDLGDRVLDDRDAIAMMREELSKKAGKSSPLKLPGKFAISQVAQKKQR